MLPGYTRRVRWCALGVASALLVGWLWMAGGIFVFLCQETAELQLWGLPVCISYVFTHMLEFGGLGWAKDVYGNRVRDGSVASDFECFLLERWLLILLFPKAVLESFRQWSHTLNEHTYPLIGVFSMCSFSLYLAKTSPLMRYIFRMPRPTMTDTGCFPKATGGRVLSG